MIKIPGISSAAAVSSKLHDSKLPIRNEVGPAPFVLSPRADSTTRVGVPAAATGTDAAREVRSVRFDVPAKSDPFAILNGYWQWKNANAESVPGGKTALDEIELSLLAPIQTNDNTIDLRACDPATLQALDHQVMSDVLSRAHQGGVMIKQILLPPGMNRPSWIAGSIGI